MTVELAAEPSGTRLTYTEQYVFLAPSGEGSPDVAEREGGLRLLLHRLASVVGAEGGGGV
ncbi:MAG: hypothetical protein ACRD2C_07430 [Acidimicrobiales bacterium]